MLEHISLGGNCNANKAFKSDSKRLAFSLRSNIAKRSSHLNAALGISYMVKHSGV